MKYFAYGSNLHTGRLQERTPSARVVTTARLLGHRLRFHKKSDLDGSGKCDAWRTRHAEAEVLGVVWEIAPAEKPLLDRIEGVGMGYTEEIVEVVTDAGILTAFTYLAQPHWIEPTLRPFQWYKDFVVHGARQHGLDWAYIDRIVESPADRDPDRERARANTRRCSVEARTQNGRVR